MKLSSLLRQHTAALRALLVLTVLLGLVYPASIWLIAQLPGLRDRADGSLVTQAGKPVGSSLIGQPFTGPQYFQGRPSAAGDGYDPLASGASNLGPEDIVDAPDRPSLLSQVCARSKAVARFEGLPDEAGARPYCTGGGVGAVLSVLGPRGADGHVTHPARVVSVNEPCAATDRPFLDTYAGVRVECARPGEDYSAGEIIPVRGDAPDPSPVPADAVTASGSGLDPDISPEYAQLQVNRVAAARGMRPEAVRALVDAHTEGRTLGFLGEPRVNVLELNLALDGG
ncbi:potassium-transporting ATPase subunit C [Mycobacterium sp. GA-2829]|uniref:potassium-transporting ATPase subunit C n=1 Tax=Mycobacterium sp. GA-2829 TaxID=1772283 RepID=UPI00074049F2|nr:potassium-transporting ATPase subunit C [Mycobacterium sp. GA-2829]KUI32020.1 K+-transporting ATPase subunit C [Mycobacterium sp. GA-2829]